jgi:DNA-binding MarR family transcriptional regulator
MINSLGFLSGKVHSLLKKRIQQYLDESGVPLKMENYPAFRLLMHNAGISQQTIANQIGFDRHRTSRMLDELEQAGLIARNPHPDNSREKLITLTMIGQQMQTLIEEAVVRATQDAVGSQSPDEAELVAQMLRQMVQNLSS